MQTESEKFGHRSDPKWVRKWVVGAKVSSKFCWKSGGNLLRALGLLFLSASHTFIIQFIFYYIVCPRVLRTSDIIPYIPHTYTLRARRDSPQSFVYQTTDVSSLLYYTYF